MFEHRGCRTPLGIHVGTSIAGLGGAAALERLWSVCRPVRWLQSQPARHSRLALSNASCSKCFHKIVRPLSDALHVTVSLSHGVSYFLNLDLRDPPRGRAMQIIASLNSC